jgi:hypothetical protein
MHVFFNVLFYEEVMRHISRWKHSRIYISVLVELLNFDTFYFDWTI